MMPLLALPLLGAALGLGLWPVGDDGSPARDVIAADLASSDPGRRVAAIIRLGARGQPQDLRRIRPYLEGGDVSLRLAAARALVKAGDLDGLGRVAAQAASERAPVRFEALTLLREAATLPDRGRRAAERALGDGDPAMRLVALEVLNVHAARESVPYVAGSITDSNREVRLAAVRLLGVSRDGRALLPLLERIDTTDRSERLAIIDALGSIAGDGTLAAGPALSRQLVDSNDDVRVAAIEAIARLRFTAAVPILVSIATRARDAMARRAILALGAIADPAAIDALTDLLREPAPGDDVVEALRRAGPRAVRPVAAVLTEGYSTSAAAAAVTLAAIGDRAATPALVAVLGTRPLVAIAAARALGSLRDPRAVPGLMAAVTDGRYEAAVGTREACLRALAAIGDDRAAAVAESAARDRHADVRAAAVDLAAALHGGIARDTLGARIVDGDAAVRRRAIAAAASLPSLRPASLLLDGAGRNRDVMGEDPGTFADALAASVTEGDGVRLWAELGRSAGTWRVILLRALAALAPAVASPDQAEALRSEILAGGAGARAAAEILSGARAVRLAWLPVLARLRDLEPATRTRLCPALARAATAETDVALADLIDHDPDPGVRAAAAWSARGRRGSPEIDAALRRAARSPFPPIAQNAVGARSPERPTTRRGEAHDDGDLHHDGEPHDGGEPHADRNAIRTGGGGTRDGGGAGSITLPGPVKTWATIRLLTPEGGRAAGQWVRVRVGSTTMVWALTDDAGEARLTDLPPGPLRMFAEGGR